MGLSKYNEKSQKKQQNNPEAELEEHLQTTNCMINDQIWGRFQ